MTPSVSVVIPAYNSEAHIGQTISSVLTQTFEDFELVVVDDCSTDGTLEVARSFSDNRMRVLANRRNLGAVANWNTAVREAGGSLVKLLCGDDVLYPSCLEHQVSAMRRGQDDGVVMAACRRDIVDESGQDLLLGRGLPGMAGVVDGRGAMRRAVRAGTNIFGEPAAVLLRADVLARCGPFSGHLPYVIDLEMWCRVLSHGRLFAIEQALCAFRVVSTSWSSQLARSQSAQTRALLREVRHRHPDEVRRRDQLLGETRTTAVGAGRRLAYRLLAARGRAGRYRALARLVATRRSATDPRER